MTRTRSPVLAGTWYPGRAKALAEEVDGFLAAAEMLPASDRPAGRALLAVVPHAGYVYSGESAGRLYGLLDRRAPARVFILAPNHRTPLHAAALSGSAAYATPLGEVPVDAAAVEELAASPAFAIDDRAHASEHAVEIQLPFLQRLWPDQAYGMVPILVPHLDERLRAEAARALAAACGEDSLVIISSDFTHYGSAYGYVPFAEDIPASLERLDTGAILKILAADAAGLIDYGRRTGITMCGLAAAAVALEAGLPAGYEGALIDYRRSADRESDFSMSVSYASILMTSGRGEPAANESTDHA